MICHECGTFITNIFYIFIMSFPGGSVIRNLPASAGDTGDAGPIPGLGRWPGVRK